MSQRVACQPSNNESIPWQNECRVCDGLKRGPQPGLSSWVLGVATHMECDHDVILVGR